MKERATACHSEDEFYNSIHELANLVGRLCIRMLRNYNASICQIPLFKYMQQDDIFLICKKTSESLEVKDYEQIKREEMQLAL